MIAAWLMSVSIEERERGCCRTVSASDLDSPEAFAFETVLLPSVLAVLAGRFVMT